jgi:hypothetical protein
MDADLDLLLTTVFVTADDLLPQRQNNAARSATDAEVVTLCVAQAIMGIPSDRRFLAVAAKRLHHLFPRLPKQPGYFKRRRKLADTLEWLMGIFASQSPGLPRTTDIAPALGRAPDSGSGPRQRSRPFGRRPSARASLVHASTGTAASRSATISSRAVLVRATCVAKRRVSRAHMRASPASAASSSAVSTSASTLAPSIAALGRR